MADIDLGRLVATLEIYNKASAELTKFASDLTATARAAEAAGGKIAAALGEKVTGSIKTAEVEVDKLAEKISKAGKQGEDAFRRAGFGLTELGRGLESAGRLWSLAISAPMLAAGVASVKFASDFEAAMVRVQTLAGATAAEVRNLTESVLQLAQRTAQAPVEVAKGLFVAESAGFRGAAAMDILSQSSQMAAIGMGTVEENTRAVVSALLSYGDGSLNASKVADIFVRTVQLGNMRISELIPNLGRVMPIAAEFGVSLADVTASIATFSHLGVSVDRATSGLVQILSIISRDAPRAQIGFRALGMSVEDFRREVATKGLTESLIHLVQIAEATPKGMQGFEKVFGNIRAFTEAMSNAGPQAENYKRITEEIARAQGQLALQFDTTGKTFQFRFQQLITQVEVLAIRFGTTLLPVLEKLIGVFQNWILPLVERMVRAWSQLSPVMQNIVLIFGGMTIAAGPFLLIVGQMVLTLGHLMRAFDAMAASGGIFRAVMEAINRVGAAFGNANLGTRLGGMLTGAFNPALRLLEEIGSMTTRVVMMYAQGFANINFGNAFRAGVLAAQIELSRFLATLGITANSVAQLKTVIVSAASGLGTAFMAALRSLSNLTLPDLGRGLTTGLTTAFSFALDAVRGFGRILMGELTSYWQMLPTPLLNLGLSLRTGLSSAFTLALGATQEFGRNLSTAASTLGQSVTAPLAGFGRGFSTALAASFRFVLETSKDFGRDLIEAFAIFGRELAKPFVSVGRGLSTALAASFRFVLETSKDFGRDLIEAFAIFGRELAKPFVSAGRGLSTALGASFRFILETSKDFGRDLIEAFGIFGRELVKPLVTAFNAVSGPLAEVGGRLMRVLSDGLVRASVGLDNTVIAIARRINASFGAAVFSKIEVSGGAIAALGATIGGAFTGAVNMATTAVAQLFATLRGSTIAQGLTLAWTSAVGAITSAIGRLGPLINSTLGSMNLGMIAAAFNSATSAVVRFGSVATGVMISFGEIVASVFTTSMATATGAVAGLFATIRNSSIVQGIVQTWTTVGGVIASTFGAAMSRVRELGSTAVGSITASLSTATGAATTFGTVFSGAIQGVILAASKLVITLASIATVAGTVFLAHKALEWAAEWIASFDAVAKRYLMLPEALGGKGLTEKQADAAIAQRSNIAGSKAFVESFEREGKAAQDAAKYLEQYTDSLIKNEQAKRQGQSLVAQQIAAENRAMLLRASQLAEKQAHMEGIFDPREVSKRVEAARAEVKLKVVPDFSGFNINSPDVQRIVELGRASIAKGLDPGDSVKKLIVAFDALTSQGTSAGKQPWLNPQLSSLEKANQLLKEYKQHVVDALSPKAREIAIAGFETKVLIEKIKNDLVDIGYITDNDEGALHALHDEWTKNASAANKFAKAVTEVGSAGQTAFETVGKMNAGMVSAIQAELEKGIQPTQIKETLSKPPPGLGPAPTLIEVKAVQALKNLNLEGENAFAVVKRLNPELVAQASHYLMLGNTVEHVAEALHPLNEAEVQAIDAVRRLNLEYTSAIDVVHAIDPALVKAATNYLNLGNNLEEVGRVYKELTPVQLRAIDAVRQLGDEQASAAETVASLNPALVAQVTHYLSVGTTVERVAGAFRGLTKQQIEDIDTVRRLNQSYGSLNEVQRRAIDLAYAHGQSLELVAKNLKLLPETVNHYIDMLKMQRDLQIEIARLKGDETSVSVLTLNNQTAERLRQLGAPPPTTTQRWAEMVAAINAELNKLSVPSGMVASWDAATATIQDLFQRLSPPPGVEVDWDATAQKIREALAQLPLLPPGFDDIIKFIKTSLDSFKPSPELAELYKKLFADILKAAHLTFNGIFVDMDAINKGSTASLNVVAAKATATYAYVLAHSNEFSKVTIENFSKIAVAATESAMGFQDVWGTVLDGLASMFTKLGQVAGSTGLGDFLGGIGKLVIGLQSAHEEIRKWQEATATIATVYNDATGQIEQQTVKQTANFGLLSIMMDKSADKVMKWSAGFKVALAVAAGAMNVWAATASHATAAGNMLGGAMAGAQAGAEVGGFWGAVVGGTIGLIVGAIRGQPEWARAGNELGRDLGGKLGDSFEKEVQKRADELGISVRAAYVLSLKQAIDQIGGLTESNIQGAISHFQEAILRFNSGELNAGQAAKAIGENWAEFARVGSDAVGLLDARLVHMIEDTRRAGLQVKELNDYIQKQVTDNIFAGFDEFLKNQRVKTTDMADALAGALVASVAVMQSQGMSLTDIFKKMGPWLEQLRRQMQSLGYTGDEAFTTIMNAAKLVADPLAGPVLRGIEGLGKILLGLANTAALSPATFEKLADQIGGMINDLIVKQGKSFADVIAVAQPQLQLIWELQQRFGTTLDKNTQALIDQALAAGQIGERFKSPASQMIDALMTMNQILLGIADALGAKIPDAARKAASAIGGIRPPAASTGGDGTGAGGHGGGHGGGGGGGNYAAAGGVVGQFNVMRPDDLMGRVLPFVPRGTDTVPAMLTPGERVLSVQENQQYQDVGRFLPFPSRPQPLEINPSNELQAAPSIHVTVNNNFPANTIVEKYAYERFAREIGPLIWKHVAFNVDSQFSRANASLGRKS